MKETLQQKISKIPVSTENQFNLLNTSVNDIYRYLALTNHKEYYNWAYQKTKNLCTRELLEVLSDEYINESFHKCTLNYIYGLYQDDIETMNYHKLAYLMYVLPFISLEKGENNHE